MNCEMILILLIYSVSFAFASQSDSEMYEIISMDDFDDRKNSNLQVLEKPIVSYEILDNSISYNPLVSVEINEQAEILNKERKKKFLLSWNINPILKKIESDFEISYLLNFDPGFLNEYLDYFVFSKYCFDLMNKFIDNNPYITPNSFNQIIFGYWINSVLPNKFRNENEFIYWLSNSNMDFFTFYDLLLFNFTQLDRNSSLFKKSRSFLKAMLIRYDFNEYKLRPLFKFKLTAEDIEFLLEDYQNKNSTFLDKILEIALDADMEYSAEDKLFIRNRNNELLLSIPQIPNDSQDSNTDKEIQNSLIRIRKTANYKLHVEMINSIRYSVASDNDSIIEKYFNVKGGTFDDDLTEAFAIAAILAGNIDMFYRIYHLRNQMKFSVKFYRTIAYSKKLIKIVPSEALIDFFEVPKNSYSSDDWTFRFELLARKSIDERSFSDLESLFSNDDLGKLFAKALYYPIQHYIGNLSQNMKLIPYLVELPYNAYMKFRNNLNDPFKIVYETVKFIPSLDRIKAGQLRFSAKNLLYKSEFLKTCFDPKNKSMFDQVINSMDLGYIFPLTPEIVRDSKFIESLKSSHVSKLIGKFYFNLCDLTEIRSHMLAHEIVEIAEALGLQIGNFDVDSLEDVTNIDLYRIDTNVKIFKGIQIDKILIKIALSNFETVYCFYKTSRNPMLLSSFGIFQLWIMKNPNSFMKFVPRVLFEDLIKSYQKNEVRVRFIRG